MSASDTPTLGHNQPPSPLELDPDIIADQWAVDHRQHIEPAERLLDSVARFDEATKRGITNVAEASKATDFAASAKRTAALLDGIRRICKDPYQTIADRADGMFKAALIDPLRRAARNAEDRLTAFQRAEARRQREEAQAEADRLAADAQRLAAAAATAGGTGDIAEVAEQVQGQADAAQHEADRSVTELSRVRGSRGATVSSIRARRDFEVVDMALVPREWLILDESKVRRELNAKNSTVTAIAGLKIVDASRAVVTGH